MTEPDLLLTDAVVLTMDAERTAYRSGYVWLRGDRIHAVGSMRDLPAPPPGAEVRSLAGRHVVMPGLVNAHGHLSTGLNRGILDELPLEAWIEGVMWRMLRAMDDAAMAEAGAALALHELMTQGVTTIANSEFSPHPEWCDGALRAVGRAGARVLCSRVTLDSADPSAPAYLVPDDLRETPAHAIAELDRLRREWSSPLVEICPEALGPLWCTEELLRAMHGYAVDNGTSLFMHMNDSQGEREASHRRYGHGSIVEMERWGCLEAPCLFAHCTFLDDEEIDLLREREVGVSHNPVANASYACGLARLPDLVAAGVRVGLGVDGAGTNNSQNLWETAKTAILLQRSALEDPGFGSAELALELLTIGGARALHMDDRIGSLEPGKQADVITIDLDRAPLAPRSRAPESLVLSYDVGAVRSVFVAGVERVRDGVHRCLDHDEVVATAQREAVRKLRNAGLDRLARERMNSRWRWL